MSTINIAKEDIHLSLSPAALSQVKLIKDNDHYLADQVFRIKIDGKGCGGFDYAIGFSEPNAEDLVLQFDNGVTLHIDPFTAYYCREGVIEFIFDPEKDIEGFSYINPNEKKYRGKFFKNEEMVPKV